MLNTRSFPQLQLDPDFGRFFFQQGYDLPDLLLFFQRSESRIPPECMQYPSQSIYGQIIYGKTVETFPSSVVEFLEQDLQDFFPFFQFAHILFKISPGFREVFLHPAIRDERIRISDVPVSFTGIFGALKTKLDGTVSFGAIDHRTGRMLVLKIVSAASGTPGCSVRDMPRTQSAIKAA